MSFFRRFLALPLRTKLILSLAAISLTIIFVALFAIFQYNQTIPSSTSSVVHEVADERSTTIGLTMEQQRDITVQVANDPYNQTNFARLNDAPDLVPVSRALQVAFRQMVNVEPTIREIRFISSTGHALVSIPAASENLDETSQPYYKALTSGTGGNNSNVYVSSISTEAAPSIEYVAPSITNGKNVGFVAIKFDLTGSADPNSGSVFHSLQHSSSSLGQIEFYLLGPDNRIVQPVDKNITTPTQSGSEVETLLSNAGDVPFQYDSPLSGLPVIGTARKLPFTSFVLVTELPFTQNTFIRNNNRFTLPLLVAVLIALLVVATFGFILEATVVRPIERAFGMASNLVQGRAINLPPIAPPEHNELNELSTLLTELAERLQSGDPTSGGLAVRRARNMMAYQHIGQAMLAAQDSSSLLQGIASSVRQSFTSVENLQFFEADANQTLLALRFTTDRVYGRTKSEHQWPIDVQNMIGRVALNKVPEILIDTDQRNSHETLMPNMRAELSLPLIHEGILLGVLDLQSSANNAFSQIELTLFKDVSEQLADAIYKAKQFEKLEARIKELELLNQQMLGDTWNKYVQGRQKLPAATAGQSDGNEWSNTQRKAIETNALAETIGPETVTFAIPVSLRGQILGAVEWEVPRSVYTENTRQLARELAIRLAVSADNARLFEQAQYAAQRERLVNEISSKLTQQTEVSEILKVAVREVGQALRLPQTAIRLATNEEKQG